MGKEEKEMICSKCNKENNDNNHFILKNKEHCFSCNFWQEKVDNKDSLIIVNGHVYGNAGNQPNAASKDWLGFGGRIFRFRSLGESDWQETNNMWSAGKIPEVWLEQLPNNAEFENVTKHNIGGTICWEVR